MDDLGLTVDLEDRIGVSEYRRQLRQEFHCRFVDEVRRAVDFEDVVIVTGRVRCRQGA
jgi:hypothetical protein